MERQMHCHDVQSTVLEGEVMCYGYAPGMSTADLFRIYILSAYVFWSFPKHIYKEASPLFCIIILSHHGVSTLSIILFY